MKRQSPAHKSQKRILQETELYLMSLVFYVFISKCGISDKTQTRRAQVDKGIAGPVTTVTSATVTFGWQAEKVVHMLYFLFNVTTWFPNAFKGSTGRTELFFNGSPIFGFAFLYGCHFSGTVPENWMVAMAFFPPFVWIDGWLWVQVFRIGTLALAAGLLYGAYWFLKNS